jgi:hypothetical protein
VTPYTMILASLKASLGGPLTMSWVRRCARRGSTTPLGDRNMLTA